MTTTNRKAENDLIPLFRTEYKSDHKVIRVIKSASGHTYHVCIKHGKAENCSLANGEDCKGWFYRHSCHHATLAMQLEAERDADRTACNNYELAIGA